jgi:hypothetical protein
VAGDLSIDTEGGNGDVRFASTGQGRFETGGTLSVTTNEGSILVDHTERPAGARTISAGFLSFGAGGDVTTTNAALQVPRRPKTKLRRGR